MAREIKLYEACNRLQGPVMDWCNRLYCTEVQLLDLYLPIHAHPIKPDSSVIITLSDGSVYSLKRKAKSFRGLIPEFVDTIEPLTTPPLTGPKHPPAVVNMKFKAGHFPSLHFILRACYGLQTHHGLFRASAIVADSDFFAIAITLNVARKCIHRGGFGCTPTSSGSPLKRLWHDVCTLIQNEDYTFWGDTIAEHTKNITRELVYKVARDNVAALLNQDEPQLQSMAASVVSRTEIISKRKELAEPTLWDEAWEKRWKETWNGHEERVFMDPATEPTSFLNQMVSKNALRPGVNGRAPGGIAGRTVSRIPVSNEDIFLLNTPLKGLHVHPELRPSSESKGKEREVNNVDRAEWANNNESPLECLQSSKFDRLNPSYHEMFKPKIWPGYGLLSTEQDENNNVIWASPREVAIEMAWQKAWNLSVAKGKRAAEDIMIEEKKIDTSQWANVNIQDESQNTDVLTAPRKTGRKFLFQKHRPIKNVSHLVSRVRRRSKIITSHTHNQLSLELVAPAPQPTQPAQSDPIRVIPPHNVGLPQSSVVEEEHSSTPHASPTRNFGRILSDALLSPPIPLDSDDENAFQLSVQERRYLERKEAARINGKEAVKIFRGEARWGPKPPNGGSEGAWRLMNPEIHFKPTLEMFVDQEVPILQAVEPNQPKQQNNPQPAAKLDSARKRFEETWEKAWKQSWDAAWEAVWEATWNAAVARGVEFGAELVLDNDPSLVRGKYQELRGRKSYKAVVEALGNKTGLETLEQFRIMMKELYHLYESLHHTVSDSRDNRAEIIVKEFQKASPNSSGPSLI
ncbi:unnamed protein product [Rhizoctonia solani]|uniref:Uncharacterized protein n=1 Tax=Rhizoctonia solani TaxID=456999 RepID=A0A8H3GU91_9AGAM|nr:unnamed protein product [Rhizoctonia solani]